MTLFRALALLVLASGCQSPALDFSANVGTVAVAHACPDGWEGRMGGCDAILPDAGCAAGTMPVIGSTACVAVGNAPCGAGFTPEPSGWGCTEIMPATRCTGATLEVLGKTDCQSVGDCTAAFPPAAATLFVDDSYSAGQLDATHFATVSAALAAATDGAVIAIEEGTYVGSLTLAHSVTLTGRCAEKVTLQAPVNASNPGLELTAGTSTASGLTLTGHFNGIVIDKGAALTLQHSVLSANTVVGVQVHGALVLDDSVVRDGVQDTQGDWGIGLYVDTGAHAEVHRSVIAHNAKAGIVVQDRSSALTLEASVVRDTRPSADGTNGIGVVVVDGATAALTGSVLATNSEAGLAVEGQAIAASATVDGCVIRDTVPLAHPIVDPMNPENLEYHGINVEETGRATVDLKNTSLLRSGGDSLVVTVAPAMATVTDSTLFSTTVFPNGYGTTGVIVQAGSSVSLTRSAVVQAASVGVQVYGAGTSATVTDSLVAQTQAKGSDALGQGVAIAMGATVSVTHSAITQSAGSGVFMASGGAATAGSCSIDSSVIADGTGFANGTFGRGLDLAGAATLTMISSAVVRNREVAVVAGDVGTNVLISSSVVRETGCDGMGNVGRGINAQNGAHLELDDSLLLNNHDVTLNSGAAGTTVLVQRSVIANSLARIRDGHFGLGVMALQGGRLDLKDSQVVQSAYIGVAVGASSATLAGCAVNDNAVAIQVQDGSMLQQVPTLPSTVGPLDVFVTDDTTFEGNATRVGTGTVPLPEPL